MLGGHRPSFLLGIYIGVEFLDYTIFEYLALVDTHTIFQTGCISLLSQQRYRRVPVALHPRQQLIFSFHSDLATLMAVYKNKI